MEINQIKTVPVNAKTISIYMKVSDSFFANLLDQDGKQIGKDYEGYVPSFMPGQHYGDYLILEIDVDTGMIKNWKTPKPDEIEKVFIKNDEE
jgi:hypothetical protein